MNKIAITADSICDIPKKVCEENDIGIIYFDIETENGFFKDSVEITTSNIFEYLSGGEHKAESHESKPTDYRKFFVSKLEEYDEVIHICLSGGTGIAVKNANLARAQLGIEGQKVHVFDSRTLSVGMGIIVLEAVRLRNEGLNVKEIVNRLSDFEKTVNSSFLVKNVDYLYYNNRVSKKVMTICNLLGLHPVLNMKNGELVVKKVYFGNYDKACKSYLRSSLKKYNNDAPNSLFFVYAGVPIAVIEQYKEYVYKTTKIKIDVVPSNSAAVGANCGAGSIGIMYANKV